MLTACMIVKNEAEMLRETLPTLVKGVDELIIVDTGSTDDTVVVARSFGAIVVDFPWINDFAAARNASLKRATRAWIIWLDADEFVRTEDLSALKKYLPGVPPEQLGIMLPIYECKRGELNSPVFYSRVKVFRNNKGTHFTRPINEQVTAKDGRFIQEPFVDITRIYHWGNIELPPEQFMAKKKRNIALLESILKQYKNDFYYLYLIAKNYVDIQDYSQALEYLDEIKNNPDIAIPSHVFEEYYKLRLPTILALGRTSEYAELLVAIAADNPGFFWVQWKYGYYLLQNSRIEEARVIAQQILELPPPNSAHGSAVDLESYYYWPYYLLGVIADLTGNSEVAISNYVKAQEFSPNENLDLRIKNLKGEMS